MSKNANGMLKATVTNKKVVPNVCIEVWHAGRNDYRVIFTGIGQHSAHPQYSPALHKADWLGRLSQEDLNHELARAQS